MDLFLIEHRLLTISKQIVTSYQSCLGRMQNKNLITALVFSFYIQLKKLSIDLKYFNCYPNLVSGINIFLFAIEEQKSAC